MPLRRRCGARWAVGAVLVLLTYSVPARSQGPSSVDALLPIPVPNLESEEEAVRAQLLRERAEVDALLAAGDRSAQELARAMGTLGELYYLYDLKEAAGVCWENAVQLTPGEVRLHYLLAVVETLRGSPEAALERLAIVLETQPTNTAALIRSGRLQFDLTQLEAAKTAFKRALEIRPSSAAALGGLGNVAVREGKHAEALPLLSRAIELQPGADSLYYSLGQALRGTGDTKGARAAFAKTKSGRLLFDDPWVQQMMQFSVSTEGLFHAGNRALRNNDFAEAVVHFESYVAANPKHVRARYNLALCYFQVSRREDSLRLIEEVLADDPNTRGGHRLMADALAEGGDLEPSLVHFERAHQAEPGEATIVADWATVLAKLGRVDEALERLSPLAAPEQKEHYARLKYATILATSGRQSEALPILRDIVGSGGLRKNLRAEALYHIGSLALRAGERRVAQRSFEQALELDPELVQASAALAPLVAGGGDLERGAALYRIVTQSTPADDRAQFGLAMSLLLARRDAEAKEALEQGVAGLPDNDDLRHFLARLLAASDDAAVREPDRAVSMARALLQRNPNPEYAETLAMAFAASGAYAEAVALQQRVVDQAASAGEAGSDQRKRMQRLEAYRAEIPVRSPWRGSP